MSVGVYKITNIKTNKFYIGSSNNVEYRWCEHRNDLRANRHVNRHLQSSYNKHGEESFIYEIIEYCSNEEQFEREQYYLDTLQPFGKKGYNIAVNVKSGMKGRKHSKETCEKIKKQLSKINLKGDNCVNSILTEKQVIDIKQRLYNGDRIIDISKDYNVSKGCIQSIKCLNTWSHVLPELNSVISSRGIKMKSKDEYKRICDDIIELFEKGMSPVEIKNELNIKHLAHIGNVIKRYKMTNGKLYIDIKLPDDPKKKRKPKAEISKETRLRYEEIGVFRHEGHSVNETMVKFNVGKTTVTEGYRYFLKKYNLTHREMSKLKNISNTDLEILDKEIIKLYREGLSIQAISKIVGIGHNSVRKRLNKNNIKRS